MEQFRQSRPELLTQRSSGICLTRAACRIETHEVALIRHVAFVGSVLDALEHVGGQSQRNAVCAGFEAGKRDALRLRQIKVIRRVVRFSASVLKAGNAFADLGALCGIPFPFRKAHVSRRDNVNLRTFSDVQSSSCIRLP